jgi:hypothetical protein
VKTRLQKVSRGEGLSAHSYSESVCQLLLRSAVPLDLLKALSTESLPVTISDARCFPRLRMLLGAGCIEAVPPLISSDTTEVVVHDITQLGWRTLGKEPPAV